MVGRIVTTSSDERAAQAMAYLLIADSLYTWPATHKLVNVSFWTEPALVFSICDAGQRYILINRVHYYIVVIIGGGNRNRFFNFF